MPVDEAKGWLVGIVGLSIENTFNEFVWYKDSKLSPVTVEKIVNAVNDFENELNKILFYAE